MRAVARWFRDIKSHLAAIIGYRRYGIKMARVSKGDAHLWVIMLCVDNDDPPYYVISLYKKAGLLWRELSLTMATSAEEAEFDFIFLQGEARRRLG